MMMMTMVRRLQYENVSFMRGAQLTKYKTQMYASPTRVTTTMEQDLHSYKRNS